MVGFIARTIGTAIALYVTTLIYTDISFGKNPEISTVLIVAILFGLVNGILKPVLKILSLPLSIMTLGLFAFIVNGALLLALAWAAHAAKLTFTVGGYPPDLGQTALVSAVVGGIVLSLVSSILDLLPLVKTSR